MALDLFSHTLSQIDHSLLPRGVGTYDWGWEMAPPSAADRVTDTGWGFKSRRSLMGGLDYCVYVLWLKKYASVDGFCFLI